MSEVSVTKTAEMMARYSETVSVTDKLGRLIAVGRLKPSERRKIFEMTDSTSALVYLPMLYAASMRSIDNDGNLTRFGFPKTIAELDSRIDIMDDEGRDAIAEAFLKLNPPKDEEAGGTLEQAKTDRGR